MNENVKQFNQALNALISVNKSGIKALLRAYNYRVPVAANQSQLNDSLTLAMSKSSAFTEDVLTLLKQASNQTYRTADGDGWDSTDTSAAMSDGVQAIGLITSAWMNVAATKANASVQNTGMVVGGKKFTTTEIVIGALIGILLLGVAGVMVVKAYKN